LGGSWGCNDLAALDVKTLDLCHWVADELRDDGEDFGGVNGHAGAVEGFVTQAVWVPVTSIWIGGTGISVGGVCSSTGV